MIEPVGGVATVDWRERVRALLRDLFEVDARALATLRICLGLLLLLDLADRARHLSTWHSEAAVYPLALANATSGPVLSLHLLSGELWVQAGLFVLAALCALALTLGWWTRLASVASWALLVSLFHRNWLLQDVGDRALVLALFWSMFLPLGNRWSLDGRRRSEPAPGRVCSVASAGLLLQPAWIFFFAAVAKLEEPSWRAGDALRVVLADDLWLRPLGELLGGVPWLTAPLTWGTLIVELLAPLLLFAPLATRFVRPAALLALLALVAGMGLCIQLGWIPWIMTACLIPFVPAALWDRLHTDLSEGPGGEPKRRAARHLLPGAALAFVLVANVDAVVGRVQLVPDRVDQAAYAAQLAQGWQMYVPPQTGRSRLSVRLLLEDGSRQEVLVGAERPGWPERAAWAPLEELWSDYRGRMFLHENVAFRGMPNELEGFLAWVSARWDAEHPTLRVRQAELIKTVRGPPGSEDADGIRPIESEELLASRSV